jgi:hypothetical protein
VHDKECLEWIIEVIIGRHLADRKVFFPCPFPLFMPQENRVFPSFFHQTFPIFFDEFREATKISSSPLSIAFYFSLSVHS